MPAETDMPPWPDLIAEMGQLREQVSHIDEDAFPFAVPHLAATPEQIAAEQRLGHPLDPQHRSFLSFGNGWPDFYMGSSPPALPPREEIWKSTPRSGGSSTTRHQDHRTAEAI